jgi:NADPH:quinone reductase-like Zn-dependent oxidoreductase
MKKAAFREAKAALALEECEAPAPAAGEVVVALKAAALNHRDVWIQKGLYPGIEYPLTPGSDGAGVVIQCGENEDASWQGKEVIINPSGQWGDNPAAQCADFQILGLPRPGTHATHIAIPADRLAVKPAALSWEQAAALPLAGLTAYRALFTRGRVTERDTVLVTGIGGGVALFALQFANAAGARVLVTSSCPEKRRRAIELGAEAAFDYTQPDWTGKVKHAVGGIDLAIDGAGGDGLGDLVGLCNPAGRIAIYGATSGLPTSLDLRKVFWNQLNILGTTMGSDDDFANMISWAEQHSVQPVVDSVYPLDDINKAYERMDKGEQFGKIVLAMES